LSKLGGGFGLLHFLKEINMHCGSNMKKRKKKSAGGEVRSSYKKGGQPMYKNGECPKGKPC